MEGIWTKLGVVVGILGTAVAVWSVARDGDSSATEELRRIRVQQEEMRREQTERERRALEDEMAKAIAERTRLTTALKRQYGDNVYSITLVNNCKHTLSAAISYKALDDQWVTEGWWNLKPGERKTTGRISRNSWLYFYAENSAQKLEWNGNNKADKTEEMVVDERFIRVGEGPLRGTNPKRVVFFGKNAGAEFREYVQAFACN
jgi:hypothetical protein